MSRSYQQPRDVCNKPDARSRKQKVIPPISPRNPCRVRFTGVEPRLDVPSVNRRQEALHDPTRAPQSDRARRGARSSPSQIVTALEKLRDTNAIDTNGVPSVRVFDKIYQRPPSASLADPTFGRATTDVIDSERAVEGRQLRSAGAEDDRGGGRGARRRRRRQGARWKTPAAPSSARAEPRALSAGAT